MSSIFKKISPKTFGLHCVTYLVSTGIMNGWSTWLGMSVLCQCFLHFLPTASTLACYHLFWPQLQYPKLHLMWVAGRYKPLTPISPLPSSLARTNLISCTIISRVVRDVTQSPILMVNTVLRIKMMRSCQCLWVSRSLNSSTPIINFCSIHLKLVWNQGKCKMREVELTHSKKNGVATEKLLVCVWNLMAHDDVMWSEVKGKLANGVGSQYSDTTSECGVSSITKADAHTSAASVFGLKLV